MKRYLGIDHGDRRIGVAISDPTGTIARPHTLIANQPDPQAVASIAAIAREYEVAQVVVGLPQNMDGSEGFRAERTRKFAELLQSAIPEIPVVFIDERLTTMQADRSLRMMDTNRKDRKQKIDCMAASLLLQTFLDRISAEARRNEDPFA